MPWSTPSLKSIRQTVRDSVAGTLPGADAMLPNSVLRVLCDVMGALCQLTLQYIDWLALQLIPDTAEQEWLDRHGDIWLVNSDGSTGRKLATPSFGTSFFTGTIGVVIPQYTRLAYGALQFETTQNVTVADTQSPGPIRALSAGSIGNLLPATSLTLVDSVPGLDNTTIVDQLVGGTDDETDDQLRARVLRRIRQPPMGGAAYDYEAWALAVPGVTRAWCFPMEMGLGTVTVRFMCDDLRADNDGFPLPADIDRVRDYLLTVRPVTVKDMFVEAPIPYPVDAHFVYLDSDDAGTRAAIVSSLDATFRAKQAPGLKWYRAWTDQGIAAAPGVVAYDLDADDVAMPSPGYMPVLGDVTYG